MALTLVYAELWSLSLFFFENENFIKNHPGSEISESTAISSDGGGTRDLAALARLWAEVFRERSIWTHPWSFSNLESLEAIEEIICPLALESSILN